MKKLIFVLGLSATMTGVFARTFNNVTNMKVVIEEGKKVEIEASKLPEKATKTITDANKDSKITKAFQVIDASGNVTGYHVMTEVGEKKEMFKFDKDGNLVKETAKPAEEEKK